MHDGHCSEDRHGWNIINFKNPRHPFVSQRLRNVQVKFHRYRPNFGTLLLHCLMEWRTIIFAVIFATFFCGIKKLAIHFFFRNLHLLSFPTIYSLACFPLKWRAYEFFPGGHGRTPAKVRSNIKSQHTWSYPLTLRTPVTTFHLPMSLILCPQFPHITYLRHFPFSRPHTPNPMSPCPRSLISTFQISYLHASPKHCFQSPSPTLSHSYNRVLLSLFEQQ